MAVDLAELKVELNTDPNAYGYATHISLGRMESVAGLINQERSELPQIPRTIVLRAHILGRTDHGDYYALSSERRLLFDTYTLTDINMEQSPQMQSQIESLFPAEAETVGALQTFVWNEKSSRAEQLWGTGTLVSWQQCVEALALP
jgi:hypothetical protein